MGKKLLKVLKTIGLILFLWFLAHSVFMIYDGLNDHPKNSNVIVILGNTVEKNGKVSPRLKARLEKGLQLYQQNFAQNIIMSGGFGREGYDEAEVMKKYLVEKGIPPQNIVTDSKGINTMESARNVKTIMNGQNWHSAILVSQYFHLTRSKLAFSKTGIEKLSSAPADFFELRDLYSIPREFIGFYAYLFQ